MEFTNPIIPGFTPDPSVVLVDGVFFLATSSFHVFPGIPIYASRDLQTWSQIGNAIHLPEQLDLRDGSVLTAPLRTGGTTLGLFAPTIRHHKGRFYIVCTNAKTHSSFSVDNFIIWTGDIWNGPWSDPMAIPFPQPATFGLTQICDTNRRVATDSWTVKSTLNTTSGAP